MAYVCAAPHPRATNRLTTNPKVGVVTATCGTSGPATLPNTGQQWPLPLL